MVTDIFGLLSRSVDNLLFILLCDTFSYGVVLKELSDKARAREMLMKSLAMVPLLWCSWEELAKLCEDREMVCE